jgi:hypothetical protein
MIDSKNAYQDDLLATTWLGEVVDVEDPQKVGRIKVKVYGKFDDLKTEDIPWAYPGNNHIGSSPSGGGFFSVPKKGSIVSVKFDMGNIYHPEYFFLQKISDDVKTEVGADYPTNDNTKTTHVILYDTADAKNLVKVYYTTTKGLMLDFLETQINIKPDKSIDIHTASKNSKILIEDDGKLTVYHKGAIKIDCDDKADITVKNEVNLKCKSLIVDHASSIELGKGATEKVILGNKFMTLFNSHTHIGNLGAPTSPPIAPMTPGELSQKNVKVK